MNQGGITPSDCLSQNHVESEVVNWDDINDRTQFNLDKNNENVKEIDFNPFEEQVRDELSPFFCVQCEKSEECAFGLVEAVECKNRNLSGSEEFCYTHYDIGKRILM